MQKVIDTHAWIGKTNVGGGIGATVDDYNRLQDRLHKRECIDARFLIIPLSEEATFNLSSYVESNKGLFLGGLVHFNPNRALEKMVGYISTEQARQVIEQGNIVGMKFDTALVRTRINDDSAMPFIDLAIEYSLPVLAHCSSQGKDYTSPEHIRDLMGKRPELRLVLAHYGGLNRRYV